MSWMWWIQKNKKLQNLTTEKEAATENHTWLNSRQFKILECLDLFSHLKVKKKWEKVAEEQGISKSLVVKWNKNGLLENQDRGSRIENQGFIIYFCFFFLLFEKFMV